MAGPAGLQIAQTVRLLPVNTMNQRERRACRAHERLKPADMALITPIFRVHATAHVTAQALVHRVLRRPPLDQFVTNPAMTEGALETGSAGQVVYPYATRDNERSALLNRMTGQTADVRYPGCIADDG
jgi:hypothetical protein